LVRAAARRPGAVPPPARVVDEAAEGGAARRRRAPGAPLRPQRLPDAGAVGRVAADRRPLRGSRGGGPPLPAGPAQADPTLVPPGPRLPRPEAHRRGDRDRGPARARRAEVLGRLAAAGATLRRGGPVRAGHPPAPP